MVGMIILLSIISMIINQKYILNQASLNRGTHKIKLSIDDKTVTIGSQEPNSVFSPTGNGSEFTNSIL